MVPVASALALVFSSTGVRSFSPQGSGFPNSVTPGKPAQDREKDRKPHPGAQPLVPREKVTMVSQT